MRQRKPGKAALDLAEHFRQAGIGPAECAHICIDCQPLYVNSDHARHKARTIAERISPAFRDAGIRNYWIYLKRR